VDQATLQALAKSTRRGPLWTPDAGGAPLAIGRPEIERLIPHREPFLLLDEITGVDLRGRTARGRRRLDPGDPVFAGHFPGRPIYPGVLQLEAIGQLGLCLLQMLAAGSTTREAPAGARDARAVRVHTAQFHAPLGPGDDMTLMSSVVEQDDFVATCAGQIWRGSTLCSFGVMEVYFVDG
jgi:3-hydroxyacyl-[acyl-carrier-protein] dehydratase